MNLILSTPGRGALISAHRMIVSKHLPSRALNAGYASPVRTPRGRDIFAACGQLKSESQRARRQKTGFAR